MEETSKQVVDAEGVRRGGEQFAISSLGFGHAALDVQLQCGIERDGLFRRSWHGAVLSLWCVGACPQGLRVKKTPYGILGYGSSSATFVALANKISFQ